MKKNRYGKMFVLSSPSGAGKTTLTKKLAENNPNFKISISHTTRKPRPNEINGKDYHFIDKKNFSFHLKKIIILITIFKLHLLRVDHKRNLSQNHLL